MNAHEVEVGYWFCGDRKALTENRDRRKFPGADIRICGMAGQYSEMETLMTALSELPSQDPGQLSCGDALWCYGQREKRSKYVKLAGWRFPCLPESRWERERRMA